MTSAITCPPIPIPDHGTVNTSIAIFNTHVRVWCEPGYAFSDYNTSTVIVCQDDGEWSVVVGECFGEYVYNTLKIRIFLLKFCIF